MSSQSLRGRDAFIQGLQHSAPLARTTTTAVVSHDKTCVPHELFNTDLGRWEIATCLHHVKPPCLKVAGLYQGRCDEHATNDYQLMVAHSTLSTLTYKMLGLFTTAAREPGEVITQYTGDILTEQEYQKRYPDSSKAHYCLVISVPNQPRTLVTIDARSSQSCVARYANDGTPSGVANNCKFRLERISSSALSGKRSNAQTCTYAVQVVATRFIAAEAEILIDYGAEFWQADRLPQLITH